MDNDENEIVKERPAQLDVRYRPGTYGFTSKTLADPENEEEKSPYEKMLEDETEKENRRRQALGLGFVLGTPNDDSDGTILFNYDEPPAPTTEEDEYRNQSFAMDSDSTLNNALRRAIREQQDQEMNKRFMEGGSSGSSLESVGSTCDIDERDLDVVSALAAQQNVSGTLLTPEYDSKSGEKQTQGSQLKQLDSKSDQSREHKNGQESKEGTKFVKPLHEQSKLQQMNQQSSSNPQPSNPKSSSNQIAMQQQVSNTQSTNQQTTQLHSLSQTNQLQGLQKDQPKKQQEQIQQIQLQSRQDVVVHLQDNNLEQQNTQQQIPIVDEEVPLDVISNPAIATKVKKQSFLRRFFGKK